MGSGVDCMAQQYSRGGIVKEAQVSGGGTPLSPLFFSPLNPAICQGQGGIWATPESAFRAAPRPRFGLAMGAQPLRLVTTPRPTSR